MTSYVRRQKKIEASVVLNFIIVIACAWCLDGQGSLICCLTQQTSFLK